MRRTTLTNGFLGLSLTVLVGLGLVGCATPNELSQPRTTSEMAQARASNMTVEQAQSLLDDLHKKLAADDAQNPLRSPKSLDDVLAVLQSDQIDLFPEAVKFAKAQNNVKGRTLAAQLELAWGENQRIVAQIIDLLAVDMREESRELAELEASGKAAPEDQKRLARLETLVNEEAPIISALSRVAPGHIRNGAAMAEELVKSAPEGYEGYRVLADYHRIRSDWASFDAMVKEVETRHPQSVGLLFLKGVSEAERKGDLDAGQKLLREALTKDPKFCRAQAQLVFMANGLTAKYEEYTKLKAMNPRHQLVLVAGPVIEAVYETREKRRNRTRRLDWRQQF